MAGFITSSLGVPLAALASFGAAYLLLRRSRPGLLLTIAAAVPVLLLLASSPFIFAKDRYVFVTLTCWVMLAAGAATALLSQLEGSGRVLAVGVVLMLIADATWENVQYYQVINGNRRDWKGGRAPLRWYNTGEKAAISSSRRGLNWPPTIWVKTCPGWGTFSPTL